MISGVFFDFVRSYDSEWCNWIECFSLYEEYRTARD